MGRKPSAMKDEGQAARIVVVQAEPPPRAPPLPWVPVGALLWERREGRQLAIVVKTTFTWSGESPDGSGVVTARLADRQEPLAGDDFDFGRYDAAPPEQRAAAIEPDHVLALGGVAPSGARRLVRLPGLVPLVTLDGPDGGEDVPLLLACDTLLVDVDGERATTSWRGSIPTDADGGELERVVVSLWDFRVPIDFEARRSALMRGLIGFAVRPGDPPGAEAARDEAETREIEAARWATWGADAPEPRITLERYAAVAAELAERPDDRSVILSRAGVTEERWAVEERAWVEAMGDGAMDGDTRTAERFAELYAAAEDALATDDPSLVFAAYRISLPAWLRMARRWQDRASRDPGLAAELERLIASATPRGPTPADAGTELADEDTEPAG